MKKLIGLVLLQFLLISNLLAQVSGEKEILKNLLHDFLKGASENNAEVHDRFWAEDLIYTSSNGERVTKDDIMNGLVDEENSMNSDMPVYHAEETEIRLFDDMAVVAFKLIANFQSDRSERMEFYNTGTFQKRDGRWKVVAWQATRIPLD